MPIFDFIVELETTPTLFTIKGNNPRYFKRVLLHDSITSFPTAELVVPENSNLYLEKYFPIEGVAASIKFGNESFKYLTPQFYLGHNSMSKIVKDTYINGDLFIRLYSKFIIDAREDKNASFYDEISNIISTKIQTYNYLTPKISTTANKDYWYQAQPNWDFFKTLQERSFNSQFEFSPYLMFINLHNEFVFKPIQELFNQTSIGTYILDNSEKASFNRNNILSYSIVNQGDQANKRMYNVEVQTEEKDTKLEATQYKLEKFLYSSNTQKKKSAPILSSLSDVVTDVRYYGLNFDDNPNNAKGFRNYQFLDTAFPLQIEATIFYNREAVTGKMISTSTTTLDKNKPSKTYTDDWLIIESNHFYDPDGIAYSTLILGKNTLELPFDHPLFAQVIKKL